ncbi:glycosyltransferase family 4 protein [Acidicapsa dinghuensis]|uniref:Glycosyltransferase family 4 protein n=1 Tax=Acidicapsa dinghuensis TaxID=2218256 RepID=A0ABW1EJ08_9BACT|nr:glycosyltransferase family 4 protein [Acidicapsa dinghuensis]
MPDIKLKILGAPAFDPRTGNPYCSLLYEHLQELGVEVEEFSLRRALFGRHQVFHFHWPERHLGSHLLKAIAGIHLVLACIVWAKSRKTRVFWTAHNLVSHRRRHPRLESYFWFLFTRLLDGVIFLSSDGLIAAQKQFPGLKNVPGFVVPHGHYRSVIPCDVDRENARKSLGLPAECRVFLFFGRISGYKNVPHLIRSFRQSAYQEWRLCIVGNLSPDVALNELISSVHGDPRILLRIGWVSTEDIQTHFRSADLMVLPYREISNSGSALLALSMDLPLLTVAQGALPELQQNVGKEWIRFYEGELTSNDLSQGIDWAMHTSRSDRAPLEAFEWPAIAQMTLNAFRAVILNTENQKEFGFGLELK